MNEELFGILNDADEVMESVEYDPFGMNIVTEETNVNINSLTAKDLQDPEKLDAITVQLNNINSANKAASVLSKITKVLAAGSVATTGLGVAGDNVFVTAKGIKWTLLNGILAVVSSRVKKSITKKNVSELNQVNSLLTTSIDDMKKAITKASSDDEKKKLQDSIDKAEKVKSYIESNLQKWAKG